MFFYNDDLYIAISFILYTKIYIFIIRFLIRHDYVYYKYNVFYLLKTFINDFKKINRRNNL